MSQRKEKYLRSALTQYEGIARDVDYLKNKVAVMDRDLNMARDRQAELGRAVKQREDAEERGRRERTRRARERNRRRKAHRRIVALAALTVLASVLLIIVVARVMAEPETELEEEAETVKTAGAVQLLPLLELGESEQPVFYCEEIPLTIEEQMELFNAADAFDIWYPLAVAMVDVETSFQNVAGDGGASIGYLQVNGTLHTALMEQVGATDLWVPRDNFRTGLAYLAQQLERTDTVHKALMAYNMGPSGAAAVWERGIYESEYSQKVMERAEYWAAVMGW
ncbi:lytic transglycosylase domain-containing protein [Flintibacter porci]|uniref:lytic transglycosylase domain-containing protein n=1 Tax=Flintibacter porci TaxID=3342383 RepID=UPI003F8C2E03